MSFQRILLRAKAELPSAFLTSDLTKAMLHEVPVEPEMLTIRNAPKSYVNVWVSGVRVSHGYPVESPAKPPFSLRHRLTS